MEQEIGATSWMMVNNKVKKGTLYYRILYNFKTSKNEKVVGVVLKNTDQEFEVFEEGTYKKITFETPRDKLRFIRVGGWFSDYEIEIFKV